MHNVTVVTPWRDALHLAKDYWAAMRVADAEVLVIDDASDPPLPNGVRLPTNVGFARSCNSGLRLARTEAVLWLNNDIAATSADWLERIRSSFCSGVLVGAELRNDPHAWVDGRPMPYLDGWCIGGMREDLLALGGLDETFDEPSYYGDNDLCLRARAAGMTLREVRTGLRHKRNGSIPQDERTAAATLANRERYVSRARELLG